MLRHFTGENEELAILILAAGSSSRMGQSKQLLLIHGEPLLKRTTRIALSIKKSNVCVVLGANEEAHRNAIRDLSVEIVINDQWQKGIGRSIKAGVQHILNVSPQTESVIILVCDQPNLTTDVLKKLIDSYKTSGTTIVASQYGETFGVPALFNKIHFDELLNLEYDQGAKKIIQKYAANMRAIEFKGGAVDLDTMEDYRRFGNK